MEKTIITFSANEQKLIKTGGIECYASNIVSYIEAHFDLGANWSGYDSVRAVWSNDNNMTVISTVLDSNGICVVPFEVLKTKGIVKVNLVGSISVSDVLTDRLTTFPCEAVKVTAKAKIEGSETQPITPSQFEQFVAAVRSLVETVKDIDRIELNADYTLTIYYTDGTSDTTGSIRGADGNGIESIAKTSTSGLVDTYTITFTDGNTTTLTVTNGVKGDTGNGIASIEKTSTAGLVDTYTITYTNGTTTTFTVTNGEKGDKGDTGEVSQAEFDEAVSDLKSDITHLDEGKTYINGNINSWYFGYFSSDGSFNSVDSNVAPTNTPFIIKGGQKLTIIPNGMNVQIRIFTYSGGVYTQVSSTIYTANTELNFAADTYISLHANKTGVAHLVVSDITCKIYQESLIKQYIDSSYDELKNELVEYVDENLTAGSVYDSVHDGYYAWASDGTNPYTAGEGYISYELIIKHPCTLYVSNNSELYLSVCVFDNSSYDNGVRYREFGSEHTLPAIGNPLSLTTGQCIIITEDKTGAFTFILTDYKPAFNGDIQLAPEHIAQVERALPQVSKKYLKYINGSGADSSTEKVEIYVPTADGYIRYDFLHCVNNGINADVWRIGYANHVDSNFSNSYAITTAGEWECAIKIKGRSDFSGGYMHGDEVMNNIAFIVDGVVVDITTFTTMTEFEELSIIQDSDLYDPNDSVTVFATHGSEHTFDGNDLVISQAVTYILSEIIDTSYMAMFPIAKTVSEVLVSDKDFAPITISGSVHLKDTESVIIYKNDGTVMAQFSVPKYDFWMDNVVTFLCNDNGGSLYNKCYFANTLADFSISSGKVVKTETRYKIVAQ